MTHTEAEALKLAKSWFEANTYGDEAVEVYEAIEQALAAQSAPVQPIGEVIGRNEYAGLGQIKHAKTIEWFGEPAPVGTKLYTTPPAPAVPDAIHHTDLSEHPQYIEGWNDCRAEMLKGMKP
jgi:hypothetical protein